MFWVIYKQSGRTGTEWAKIHFKTKLKRIMHKCKLSSTSKIKHTGKLSFKGKLFRWMLRNICKRIQFLEVRWSFFPQHLTLSTQKQSRYVFCGTANLTQAKTLKGHRKHFHGAEYPETGSPVWMFRESSN